MYNLLTIQSKFSNYTINWVESIEEIKQHISADNTIVVVDENIAHLYPELCKNISCIYVKAEEANKTLKMVDKLSNILINNKANIKTKLVAVGGGIIQDLVSFVASIYCRGIDYTLIPTTLLAQVDSCIGGKTSINHANRKNILGTFYPPKEVLIYPDFVNTLSRTDYLSGWGEIYKFYILQGKMSEFSVADVSARIQNGLKYKASILALDEFDKNERKWLNYGHTFGHALESSSNHNIPHGLGVILGSMIATRVAYKMGYKVKDYELTLTTGINLIRQSDLKLEKSWFDFNELIEIVKSDKKSTGELTMILVGDEPSLVNIKDFSIVKEAINEVYESI